MRLRRESKHSGKVDAQSLQVLALAQLTWGAYNKQSKQVLKIGGFYQDFLRHIRLELLDYYEKVTAGAPPRTDLYKLHHYRRLEKGLVKEIKALGVKEQALGEKLLKDTIKDVYEASSFGQSAPVHLWEAIKSEQWDMSRFSDLVWKQKETLRRALIGDIRYGLASGMPIGDLAQRLQKSTGQSEFNAYRLVRNESMIASHHAKHKAYKDLGVEKVRIVVALDERTCEICSAQAGEVMSLDEALNRLPFHVMCRCTYVAVTKDNELVTEKEAEDKGKLFNETKVNWEYIRSSEYRAKFDLITVDPEVNQLLYDKTMDILKHQDGKIEEDMYLISRSLKKVVGSQTHSVNKNGVLNYNESLNRAWKKHNDLISLHNHPFSSTPSGEDYGSNALRGYTLGVVACHNGDLYVYNVNKVRASGGDVATLYNLELAEARKTIYNEDEAIKHVFSKLRKIATLEMKKL